MTSLLEIGGPSALPPAPDGLAVSFGEDAPPGRCLPDHPLVLALFAALMAAGPEAASSGWRGVGSDARNVQRLGSARIEICLEAATPEAAWAALAAVTPLSLDLLAIRLSRPEAGHPAAPRLIRASEVLRQKGCRRFGDERLALQRQLGREAQTLRRLTAEPGGPLLFELSPLETPEVAFLYQPGPWLAALFRTQPTQLLPPNVFRFDHRANRGADVLAKKLAITLALSMSEGAPKAARSVRSLLRQIGATRADLATREGRGGRLVDRFDEALLRLEEQGLFRARYRGPEGERLKGCVRRWLASQVVITRMSATAVR
jgi:hypothetical protein